MIYSNKDTTIEKNGDYYIINCKNPTLLKSYNEIVGNLVKSIDTSSLQFTAKSVQTLAQLLSHHQYGLDYSTVNAFIVSLARQLTFLERTNLGIIHYSLHDIIVVNESRFFFANNSLISPIYNGNLDILQPLKPNKFMSPETLLIRELPATLDYRSAYYSLGVLSAFILLKVDINYKKIDPELDPIIATSIYWGIKRGVVKNPEDRYLLYT